MSNPPKVTLNMCSVCPCGAKSVCVDTSENGGWRVWGSVKISRYVREVQPGEDLYDKAIKGYQQILDEGRGEEHEPALLESMKIAHSQALEGT